MQEWHLVFSRGPESENNATRSGLNSTISRCFAKYGKRWQRRKSFGIWSGLSESNRHLNLGKVPYYHYTKAAWTTTFIARFSPKRQGTPQTVEKNQANQETCVTRADLTMGERRWRSAKRVAFSLFV
jgi:hypothetical protein